MITIFFLRCVSGMLAEGHAFLSAQGNALRKKGDHFGNLRHNGPSFHPTSNCWSVGPDHVSYISTVPQGVALGWVNESPFRAGCFSQSAEYTLVNKKEVETLSIQQEKVQYSFSRTSYFRTPYQFPLIRPKKPTADSAAKQSKAKSRPCRA
jgi:hypothetical protein